MIRLVITSLIPVKIRYYEAISTIFQGDMERERDMRDIQGDIYVIRRPFRYMGTSAVRSHQLYETTSCVGPPAV